MPTRTNVLPRNLPLWCILFTVLILFVLVYETWQDSFEKHQSEYMSAVLPYMKEDDYAIRTGQRPKLVPIVEAHVRGKVIAVRDDGNLDTEVDPLLSMLLPESLHALKPDQVGTLLFVSCRDKAASGIYRSPIGDGTSGISKSVCTARLIDGQTHQLLGQKEFEGFEGSATPQTFVTSDSAPVIGPKPYRKIIAWLKELPHS